MPNTKEKEWSRRDRRVWSDYDNDWVAPPYIPGDPESGPEKHNASTYSNWHCRCMVCKEDHRRKHRKKVKCNNQLSGSGPAGGAPSSAVRSVGTGATLMGSSPSDFPTGISGSELESISA